MIKCFLYNSLYSLLAVLLFVGFCHGQVKKNTPAKVLEETKAVTGHTKMVKTQEENPTVSRYWNIHCGLADKKGNLWFGTTGEGVYRFDGKMFIQFTVKDGLNSNIVYSLLEDKAGNIWFGTDVGVCRYDGTKITRISVTAASNINFYPGIASGDSPQEKNTVWSMLQDKSGTIWFGTTAGVYCYNGKSFTRFLDNKKIINSGNLHLKMIDCMLEDINGDIWLGAGMPPGGEGVCRYNHLSVSNYMPKGEGWIRNMFQDKNRTIWLGTRHYGACGYDGKSFTYFTTREKIGNPMLEDKAGNIWFGGGENDNGFGGDGGIWRYNGKSFTNYTTKDGLGDYSVWCMIEDRKGHLWVGTRNNGLYRFDGRTFTCFSE